MRNPNNQHSLKPSTLKAAVFVLLILLYTVKSASAQSPPTGPAGGDLSGTYPNPVLATDRVRKTGDTMTGALTIQIPALQSNGLILQRGHNQVGAGVATYFMLNNSNNSNLLYAGISGSIVNSTAGSEGGALRFSTLGGAGGFTERAVIDNLGQFGIGTGTPTTKLDVAGQIRSSTGGFKFPDGTVQTTAAVGSSITAVNGGLGLTGGGTTGSLTLNFGAGTGLTAAADSVSVNYGSTAGTAVQGNTGITVSAGTGLSGGGPITLGAGGSLTLNVGAGTGLTAAADSVSVNYGSTAGTAVQGNTAITVSAGPGMSGGGSLTLGSGGSVTLTNSDLGSSQSIFKNIANAAGATQFSAGSNSDSLRFEGTGGTTVSFDGPNKKITISGSGSASGWTDGGANINLTNPLDNVGIGTAAPTNKLHVAGGTRVDGTNGRIYIGAGAVHGARGLEFIEENATTFSIRHHDPDVAWRNIAINPYAGNVGIGNLAPNSAYKLDVTGNTNVTGNLNATGTITGGTINAKYQDVAEWVESSQSLPAGTVVVLDHTKSNQVVASTRAYDTRVAGVISLQPGITLGESGETKVLVATTGRVRIKVDATRAPIQVGDLLVTGDKEGFAMKSLPVNIGGVELHRPGTLVGKALEPLAKGTSEILVLLSLQ